MAFAERSREFAHRASNRIIDHGIEAALRDKVLLRKTPEKKPAAIRNLHAIYGKKKASLGNNDMTYLDTSATAVLPKLANSLTLHSNKGLQSVQQRVDSLIDSYNETAYRK